jgi:Transposase IS4
MPGASLKRILAETNKKLVSREASTMDLPELFRFFGIFILITRFQFEKRHDLWSVLTGSQYVPAPNSGSTGMSRNRFDEIWSVIMFSAHEPEILEGMSSPDFRWTMVNDFVMDYNRHRRAKFRPSETVRVQ